MQFCHAEHSQICIALQSERFDFLALVFYQNFIEKRNEEEKKKWQ